MQVIFRVMGQGKLNRVLRTDREEEKEEAEKREAEGEGRKASKPGMARLGNTISRWSTYSGRKPNTHADCVDFILDSGRWTKRKRSTYTEIK